MEFTPEELNTIVMALAFFHYIHNDPDTYPPVEYPGIQNDIENTRKLIERLQSS
ncbi:hypothetical protein LCGC14_2081100 [marine sediment metagenome]|uniref:Uncharacterized protein n=1 Tax=marine sediment metagenome TaxID=412755 RepID=A0A0F9EFV0_9ZZZZ